MTDQRAGRLPERTRKKPAIIWLVLMQVFVCVYSFSGVMAKMASGYPFLSGGFILFFGIELVCLGIYALAWQQILKRFPLSVAYVNRAMSVLWVLVWTTFFFQEQPTLQNVCGIVLILSGVIVVTKDGN
ncbi:MAG: EamA family transporter [Clostridiales Family XIII bacterium]|jgi:drug/metabolite transporter (DMT)-like permease|nr:EamA family transporter [Clostridiales Family XIII bacterium]